MGLVPYEGSVLAIGGRHYMNGSEWASNKVFAYDLHSDKWSEMRELPYSVCHASPVTMRLPNVFWGHRGALLCTQAVFSVKYGVRESVRERSRGQFWRALGTVLAL